MCNSMAEGPYLRALQAATTQFSSLSQQVRDAEAQLHKRGEQRLAASVRQIQQHERRKLQATMQLQALRKAEAFEILPWQHDGATIRGGAQIEQGVSV